MNRMNEGEYSALFVQTLVEKMGNTVSDQKLIEKVKKRLSVTDIDVPTSNSKSIPFGQGGKIPAWPSQSSSKNPLTGKGLPILDPDFFRRNMMDEVIVVHPSMLKDFTS